ncbi:MAG: helix-turn-helix transcriptional regulator [Deltaproteobacteria bacterium]|nr:helix-turn-helix transcriptional regulator [Deltaproteobacteria bacterium]
MTDDRKELGARLREAREYLSLSQEEVAKAVGLTRSAISLIETGGRGVDALELKRLAAVYQRPIGELSGDIAETRAAPASVQHLARAAAKLTDGDRAELLRFAQFLESKAQPPKRSD